MRSYTQGRNQYGFWSKNTGSDNLLAGDDAANEDYRHLCGLKDWEFLHRTRTLLSVANTQGISLPYDCDLVREVEVVPLGQTVRWVPKLSPNDAHWAGLNLTQFTSDDAQWYRVVSGQLQLWPTPASSGNTIYVNQKCRVIDLSVPDTSVVVSAVTNGQKTVTVVGGLTTLMSGQRIRITYSGASNTGDGLWYEIAGIVSSTSLTLSRAYGGTTITAGTAAATIGQFPLLPDDFHDLPWLSAAAMYWGKEADTRADFFMKMHGEYPTGASSATGQVRNLITGYSAATTDMVVDDGRDSDNFINPNLTVTL